jgi:hypothetical protein
LLPLNALRHFFTDSDVPAEFIEQMRQAKINLTVCGENTVRSFTVDGEKPQFTIGFANQSETLPFAVDVRRSLERAAADVGSIDLVVADNQLSGEEALRVADRLVKRHIDLVIEYQIDYKAGNLIMDKFRQADIPVIAVDIPMVGATFFGVDNYRAGHMAGEALGEWIKRMWHGRIDHLLVLEEPRAGSLPEARIQGQLEGLQGSSRTTAGGANPLHRLWQHQHHQPERRGRSLKRHAQTVTRLPSSPSMMKRHSVPCRPPAMRSGSRTLLLSAKGQTG